MIPRPAKLLTSNSELRADGISNWTLPAFAVKLLDGRNFNVCPEAGACAQVCYARNGTYLFPAVRRKHLLNLHFVLDDLDGWKTAMVTELSSRRFRPTGVPKEVSRVSLDDVDDWVRQWLLSGGKAVRVHDSGDFFSDEYTDAWLDIARAVPDVLFYAYTKEVSRFRRMVDGVAPDNFRWLYSMGGRQDSLVDKDSDRHADVFLSMVSMTEEGYVDQSDNDLQAVLLPAVRIGIPANNIPHFKKRMAGKSFAGLQSDRDSNRTERLAKTQT